MGKKILPTFGPFEERVARRIAAHLERTKTCTPKKWQVIERDYKNDPHPSIVTQKGGRWVDRGGATDRRAFKNLVALGLVEHSRNGHCWLTRKCEKKLGLLRGRG